jgi:hypothetical protein
MWLAYMPARSVIMNRMTFAEVTAVHLKVNEYCFFIRNMYVASGCQSTSFSQLTIDWSPLLHHSHNSTYGIHHAIGQLEELPISHINSLHHIWSWLINMNTNAIPLKPFLIEDTTIPTSELWFTSTLKRDINLSNIGSLTNDLFDYLSQLRRLCCLNV